MELFANQQFVSHPWDRYVSFVKMISFVVLLLFALGFVADSAKLPDSFPKCNRNDANFNECMKNAVQVALPKLKKGIPNLGLIPLDPLRIIKLDINQGSGPVAVDLKFSNIDFINLMSSKINDVKVDADNYRIEIDALGVLPTILDGDYEINGKVLILPISGKGKARIELDNLQSHLIFQGKESKRDGKIYMELEDVKITFKTTRLHVRFENLFNNDKALGENMNAFLNENWKEILQEIQPAIEEALAAAFKEITRRLFSKVPYDDIFLK